MSSHILGILGINREKILRAFGFASTPKAPTEQDNLVPVMEIGPSVYADETGRRVVGADDDLVASAIMTAWQTGKEVVVNREP